MKLFRNILDEREKLEAMRVVSGAFWIVYLGLLAAIIVQAVMGADLSQIAGEFIVLLVGGTWVGIGFIRRGIHDYFTKPGFKSYILYSLAGGILMGLTAALMEFFRKGAPLSDCLRVFAKEFTIMFAVVFIISLLVGFVTKARQRRLARNYEDEDEA